MPVERTWIAAQLTQNASLYQALTSLADHADSLEKAVGVRLMSGAQGAASTPSPPPQAQWSVAAANGHFTITITAPQAAPNTAAVQYELQSAVNTNFNADSSVSTFTLGFGQVALDVVDPGVTKYWRLRARYLGSQWTSWQLYATAAGVVALASGALKTS